MAGTPTIWTIGHSRHALAEFLELLEVHGVRCVADVRTLPRSRRHPHFSAGPLSEALRSAGLVYVHMPELGGLRRPRPDSPNTALRKDAFRGYADYMETREFESGVERLLAEARQHRTAMMCAEADWRECHRGLLSDGLKARGVRVIHITPGGVSEHPFTQAARVVGGRVTYVPESLFTHAPARASPRPDRERPPRTRESPVKKKRRSPRKGVDRLRRL